MFLKQIKNSFRPALTKWADTQKSPLLIRNQSEISRFFSAPLIVDYLFYCEGTVVVAFEKLLLQDELAIDKKKNLILLSDASLLNTPKFHKIYNTLQAMLSQVQIPGSLALHSLYDMLDFFHYFLISKKPAGTNISKLADEFRFLFHSKNEFIQDVNFLEIPSVKGTRIFYSAVHIVTDENSFRFIRPVIATRNETLKKEMIEIQTKIRNLFENMSPSRFDLTTFNRDLSFHYKTAVYVECVRGHGTGLLNGGTYLLRSAIYLHDGTPVVNSDLFEVFGNKIQFKTDISFKSMYFAS